MALILKNENDISEAYVSGKAEEYITHFYVQNKMCFIV